MDGTAGVRGDPGRDRDLLADREKPSPSNPTGDESSVCPDDDDTRGVGTRDALSALRSDGDFFVGGDVDFFAAILLRLRDHQSTNGTRIKSAAAPKTTYFLSGKCRDALLTPNVRCAGIFKSAISESLRGCVWGGELGEGMHALKD